MNGGTEMDVREKLVELLKQIKYVSVENAANILIDNGVTVQEWISVKDRLPTIYDADVWSDWKPDYCPNCGAKMDGGAD